MTNLKNIELPDIGDFESVEVIEIMVNPGDNIKKEDSLITVESDKASMEIPSETEGIVKEIKVKVGDKISQGSFILILDEKNTQAQENRSLETEPTISPQPDKKATSQPLDSNKKSDLNCDVAVLGSGPGGYTAAFRAADLGKKVVLIERYSTIGGVCLNVGCIPSKALLHTAKVITDAEDTANHGVSFGSPKIDLDALRNWKSNKVVKKLTMGLSQMAKQRNIEIVEGTGVFLSSH